MRRAPRWLAFAVGLAVLIALPALIAARPLHAKSVSAQTLLARVRASSDISYSGLVQSDGDLSLPDITETGDLAALLSSTTQLRAWWRNGSNWRVDQISDDGETDTISQTVSSNISGVGDTGNQVAPGNGYIQTTQWDSTRDEATITTGAQPLRVPRAADLLPPALAQRLTPSDLAAQATRLPATRIAGRTALGLRLTPTDPATTISHVDIDVDQDTGLPMRVSVTGRGQRSASVSTSFLELSVHPPAASTLTFSAPARTALHFTAAPDLVADAARNAPFTLPGTLAGLPRTQRVSDLPVDGGAATYGRGYTALALLPLRPDLSSRVFSALAPPVGVATDIDRPSATAIAEQLPLVNALVLRSSYRSYLLAGSVTKPVLVAAAQQLVDNPPPFQRRAGE